MRLEALRLENDEKLVANGEYQVSGWLKTTINDKIFSFLRNKSFLAMAQNNKNINCITCMESDVTKLPKHITGIIVSPHPEYTFWRLHNLQSERREKFKTVIGNDCTISKLAYIADNNVKIGNHVTIEEFVSIKENVEIGDNSIIRAGSVIGGKGFEFKTQDDGELYPVEHYGGVRIGENVEIMSLVQIDKAVFPWDDTVILDGTKVGPLVQISHCCKIGSKCKILGGVTISGSCEIGDSVWIGPGVIISNCVKLEEGSYVTIGSVTVHNVKKNQRVSGNFAIPHNLFMYSMKNRLNPDD